MSKTVVIHVLLALSWMMFGVLHSVLAATTIKEKISTKLKISLRQYRIAYNVFAFISLAGVLVFLIASQSFNLFSTSSVSNVAGLTFTVCGLVIMSVCVKKYFISVSGIRYDSHMLKTDGIHRFVRHPLYSGTFLFILGLFILMPSLKNLISMLIIFGYTLLGMYFEEKKLLKTFGDQYTRYKNNVPSIIPFIKKPQIN